jgi:putative flippase GtrA
MGSLVKQPTSLPTRKVAAGGSAGAITVVLVWLAGQFGLEVPGEVASAVTVLISTVAAWFTRERG